VRWRTRAGRLPALRVLELGSFIAAPTAGRLLADFGAEVIKVERPGTGDELRRWRLHGGDTSLLFRTLNRNKRSIAIDLREPAGRDLALSLAARSDVVLENFRPGTLERWGLGPDEIKRGQPEGGAGAHHGVRPDRPLPRPPRLRRRIYSLMESLVPDYEIFGHPAPAQRQRPARGRAVRHLPLRRRRLGRDQRQRRRHLPPPDAPGGP
jgi:hypothetical protein